MARDYLHFNLVILSASKNCLCCEVNLIKQHYLNIIKFLITLQNVKLVTGECIATHKVCVLKMPSIFRLPRPIFHILANRQQMLNFDKLVSKPTHLMLPFEI
ncbi:uncharacterized protein ZBAI_04997 [Zygosaccharomyces bailii ISA1307]|nr:uncharacterized protein ZBAI_04997 [Zygosaccharomyces bailii ISA1307]